MTADALNALRPARLMGSVIDGEDVVQDAFLRVLVTPPGDDVSLRAWLFRVAHNRAMDLLRARALRHGGPLDVGSDLADETAPDALDRLMRQEAISLAIDRFTVLPATQRSAVILKDVLGESLTEIAALLEVAIDAGKGLLARGRARLNALPEVTPKLAPRPASPETARFVTLFNDRDWEALRGLLAADAKLQQSAYPLREGPTVREFFGIYATYNDVHLEAASLEGREVIAAFDGKNTSPSHIMWLEWRNGEIIFIHDYRYVAYVISETAPEMAWR